MKGRKINLTNDRAVKSVKWQPGFPSRFRIKDAANQGYYLRVTKTGNKTWEYRYTIDGKTKTIKLGKYPAMSCATALRDYYRAREKVLLGVDPHPKLGAGMSLSVLFNEHYLPRYAQACKRSWKMDQDLFRLHINTELGDIPAADVTVCDASKLIAELKWSKPHTARKVRALLNKLYNWALSDESEIEPGTGPLIDSSNPFQRVSNIRIRQKPPCSLTVSELRKLLARLTNSSADRVLKFMALTGCRVAESASLLRTDIQNNIILIPGERTKNGRSHTIPLIQSIKIVLRPSEDIQFPADSKSGTVTPSGVYQSLTRHLQRLNISLSGTHLLRRTFITGMAILGVRQELRDRLTNHSNSSVDGKSYNCHDYLNERTHALSRWAKLLNRSH